MLLRSICIFLILVSTSFANTEPEELFTAASQAFHNGFAEVSVRYCEEFLTDFPTDVKLPQVRLLLGQSYFLLNRFKDALKVLTELDVNDAVSFWLGESYLKIGSRDLAKTNYMRIITQFPSSTYTPQAMYSLGWLYLEQNDQDQAIDSFEKLFKTYPQNPLAQDAWLKASEAALNANNWNKAIELLNGYLKQYPQSTQTRDVFYNLAESYYNSNQYLLAHEFYKRAFEVQGQPELSLSSAIGALWSLERLNKGPELESMIKVTKDFIKQHKLSSEDLFLALGGLFLESSEYEKAFDGYDQLIRSYPHSKSTSQAYLGRANASFALKHFEDAAEDYKKLLTSSDKDLVQKAHFGLGWLYLKQGDVKEALVYFQTVIDSTTDPLIKANAYIQMADAYQDAGQMTMAITKYRRVINEFPDASNKDYVLYRQAMAHLKNDQPEIAIEILDQLKNEFPKSEYLIDREYYQGVAAFKKGDWSSAVELMENFLRALNKPSEFTPQANYILGISFLNLQRFEDALKIFQKILRLYPDHVVVAKNADLGIARCYVDLGQIKEAQKRFKIIVFKYAKSDVALEGLSWLAKNELKNNNPTQAIVYYAQALEDYGDVYSTIDSLAYEMAQAYEMLGESQNAILTYQRIKSDEELKAKSQLAIADILAKENTPEKAITAYEEVMTTFPLYSRESAMRLGQLYRNAQQYEKELQVYVNALKVPIGKTGISDSQMQFNLADTLETMSRTDESIEKYLAIPLNSDKDTLWATKAYLRVAKLYEDGKDWQGAKLTYQKIISLNTEESKYAQERLDWIKINAGRKR